MEYFLSLVGLPKTKMEGIAANPSNTIIGYNSIGLLLMMTFCYAGLHVFSNDANLQIIFN